MAGSLAGVHHLRTAIKVVWPLTTYQWPSHADVDRCTCSFTSNLATKHSRSLTSIASLPHFGVTQNTVELFVRQLARRIALRVAADLDPAGASAVGL